MKPTPKLDDFLNRAPLAILVSDIEGKIRKANTRSGELFGYEPGELIGSPIERLIPEALREIHVKHRIGYLNNPTPRNMGFGREMVGLRKDGKKIPIEIGLSSYPDGDQTLIASFISEHSVESEKTLRLFSRAVEQSISSVIITDTQGMIVYVNPTFVRLSGYSAEEVIGKKPNVSKSGQTSDEEYQELWQVINSGEEWHGELLNRKKDGGLYWVSASISPVKNSDGLITHFLAIQEDITERKKIEETLRRRNEQMSRELDLAGEVQRSFLPEELPVSEGWQFAVALQPARETSGDFYDFRLLPDKTIGILIADVMDKGVGAALFMALCWFIIRSYAERYSKDPEKVLAAINRRLLQDTKVKSFLTVFYGKLDPSSGELVYSNAGHPPPLLVTGKKHLVKPLDRTGLPLGLFKNESWKRGVVTLKPGDVLTLYTDGISEAENPGGLLYGEGKLKQMLGLNHSNSAQTIIDSLLKDLDFFHEGLEQADDIALLVIKRD
jgi:phosphoserine phosphatase RsbU/P